MTCRTLGRRGCKAEYLVDFLRHNDAATVYLVGDIVDGWRLRKSWYWPQTHNDVVQKLLRMSPETAASPMLDGSTGKTASASSPAISLRFDAAALVIELSCVDHRTVIEARYLTGA
jgi:hypothetical protein